MTDQIRVLVVEMESWTELGGTVKSALSAFVNGWDTER